MSKQNNLTDFLTGVAGAIRAKKGTTAKINPQNFESEIASISGGSELNIHYGNTAPEDTSKLWIKSEEPSNISFLIAWNPKQIANDVADTGVNLQDETTKMSAARVGTKIYIFGGQTYQYYQTPRIQVLNTIDNTIQTLSTTITSTRSSGVAAVGSKIYIFCGAASDDAGKKRIQVFDTTNNTIQTLSTTMPTVASNRSAVAIGTKIYVCSALNREFRIEKFDTETETVENVYSEYYGDRNNAGVAAVGSKIYIFGGAEYDDGSGVAKDSILIFDTTTNKSQTISTKLTQAMSASSAVAIEKKIYIFGGCINSNGITAVNTIQVFDTTNNTIQTLSTTMPSKCYSMGAAGLGLNIYLFGGQSQNGSSFYNTINLFTVDIPLSSNDIIVTQEYYARTFKVLKAPTEVEVACKYVYKGDQNLAKFIDAYLYDGANWVNVNTGATA